ncbi:hypothetical protein HPC49_42325 [Pyxidicoccus fallax]|uniref:Lipoprotein n=1 Tax=Pyxidicoccus fallax TaxID=394095 RepID=A0A848LX73_9BACT|nr:hypothetical protein [Pyxidicoccus fallax]NMO22707.1 hypothetical protein [Pyxidicoccus fallax]NPC84843.1 hypothetical protein [Pyxidicoccus fallax]
MRPLQSALALALVASGCARRPEPLASPVVNDRSITFPLDAERDAIQVGTPGQSYILEGEVLRALMIAANDLFPPGSAPTECHNRREAYTYRFTRREDVIFIYIDEDLAYCGRRLPSMDSGAKYAIARDGRLLRRIVDGVDEDDAIWRLKTPDGGVVTVIAAPGVVPDATALDAPDSGILKVISEPTGTPAEQGIEALDGGKPERTSSPLLSASRTEETK